MAERHLIRRGKTNCPKCDGHKAIAGKSAGAYPGSPATLPCPRCDSTGEVWEDSLTDTERLPRPKKFFDRNDNP